MEKSEGIEGILEEARGSIRDRVNRAADPARQKAGELWHQGTEAMRNSPGLTLGLALGSGVLAGVLLGQAFSSASESPAEKKVRNWIGDAENTWLQIRDGMEQGLSAIKKTIQLISR